MKLLKRRRLLLNLDEILLFIWTQQHRGLRLKIDDKGQNALPFYDDMIVFAENEEDVVAYMCSETTHGLGVVSSFATDNS